MTNEAERQEFEAVFDVDARAARAELATLLATLTEQANILLETHLAAEHRSQTAEGVDFAGGRASVTLINAAKAETMRTLEKVARACGVAP